MSNLGGYQWLTTMAKKVGGPEKLLALFTAGGMTIGAIGGIGGTKIAKEYKEKKKTTTKRVGVIYKIVAQGESNEGLKFDIGDTFCVLETDGDAILIEKIGDTNNPYFVDRKLLNKISDYT